MKLKRIDKTYGDKGCVLRALDTAGINNELTDFFKIFLLDNKRIAQHGLNKTEVIALMLALGYTPHKPVHNIFDNSFTTKYNYLDEYFVMTSTHFFYVKGTYYYDTQSARNECVDMIFIK